MSVDSNQPIDKVEQFGETRKLLEEASALGEVPLNSAERLLCLGLELERTPEATQAVGNFLMRHLASSPGAVIATTKKLRLLLNQLGDDVTHASFDHLIAIAYLSLGDAVRSSQYRAKSSKGYSMDAPDGSLAGLPAAIHYNATPLVTEPDFTVDPATDIVDWLTGMTTVALSDLGEPFGDFITNDRRFHRDAVDRLEMLRRRLEAKLSKPDNYLLEADPGSGKSFFVKQFKNQLSGPSGKGPVFLERNLSAYRDIDQAFGDIVLDVLIALASTRELLLFIDEVDTQIDGKHIFQKLIAPMNGDPFFFLGKEVSFAAQNLAVFYALSGKRDNVSTAPKWPDFLSRIPAAHRIALPDFSDPIERVYRSIGLLSRGRLKVEFVEAQALLFIGLTDWTSSRELQQSIELARARMHPSEEVLELAHLARHEDIEKLLDEKNVDIYGASNHHIRIAA